MMNLYLRMAKCILNITDRKESHLEVYYMMLNMDEQNQEMTILRQYLIQNHLAIQSLYC